MSYQDPNLSPSELYAAAFSYSEPKFYTMVPNILSVLTYDYLDEKTGKTEVRRLSVYAKELYRELKDIASSSQKCWMGRNGLAERCNMSEGMITKCKEELTQKFHQLDGTSLIEIKEKPKGIKKDGNLIGGTTYHEIMILNIWPWNNAYMTVKKYIKEEALSPHDSQVEALSPHDIEPRSSLSPHDTNNNNSNNNYLSDEIEPTPTGESAVSLEKEKNLFLSEDKQKIYDWLVEKKCDPRNAKSIANKFSGQDVRNASIYLTNCLEKKKAKGETLDNESKWKYFTKVLNERYWEKK